MPGASLTAITHRVISLPDESPWERLPEETNSAYEAFSVYLMMPGKRSAKLVAQQLGKNPKYIGTFCTTYRWVERADAWDAHFKTRFGMTIEEQQEAIIQGELADYTSELQAYRVAFERIKDDLLNNKANPPNLEAFNMLSQWRDRISRRGRLALGMPDKVSQTQHTGKNGGDIGVKIFLPAVVDDDGEMIS